MRLAPHACYLGGVVDAAEPRNLASSGKENGGRSSKRTDLCTGRMGKGTRDEPGASDQGFWRPEEEPSLQERLGRWPFRGDAVVPRELAPRGMGRSPGETVLLPGASRRATGPRDAGARGLCLIQGCGSPLGAIQPSAWNMNFANFRFTEFKEVRLRGCPTQRGPRPRKAPGPRPEENAYGRRTSTLAQLVPTSLLASTMQRSRPLTTLAVSRVSPSATLILSPPLPPLTTSVSLV